MTKETIWSGDIIKDFNEKLQREREEVKRLREGIEQAVKLLNTSAIEAKELLKEMIE